MCRVPTLIGHFEKFWHLQALNPDKLIEFMLLDRTPVNHKTHLFRFRSLTFRSTGDRFPIHIQQYQWYMSLAFRSSGNQFPIHIQQYQWFRSLAFRSTGDRFLIRIQ